jgi:hypothetical protein
MAIKLFAHKNVIGETAIINQETYTIIGIYEHPNKFPENLAYYGYDIVYVIQDPTTPFNVTNIDAVLDSSGQGSLGLKWFEQFPAVCTNLTSSHNLSQSWLDLKLIARGFISLYSFLLWRIAIKKGLPIYERNKHRIHNIWQQNYAMAATRISIRPLLLTACFFILCFVWLGGTAAFSLAGISVPPEYIPKKILFQQIVDSFFIYINAVNTCNTIAHPLVALIHWWRVLLMAAGITGTVILIQLRKKWEMNP